MTKFQILDMHATEMHLKLNLIKAEPNTKFEIKPQFKVEVKKNEELPKRRVVQTIVKIQSTEENPSPFDIYVDLMTVLDLEEQIWLVEDENAFAKDACAVIYPYLRSIVSNLTNSALIRPFNLPPYDGAELFSKRDENKK